MSNIVENKNPHRLANTEYYLVYVADNEEFLFPALFTQQEISKALLRASKNPEDAPPHKISWFKKLMLKLTNGCI